VTFALSFVFYLAMMRGERRERRMSGRHPARSEG